MIVPLTLVPRTGWMGASVQIRPLEIVLIGLLAASPARADGKIGVTLGIENIVRGTIAAKVRDLAKDDPVYRREQIETKPASKAVLMFNDFTTLSIGAMSTIVLDEFVYQPGGTQKIAFNALKGAFRFVTGQARKQAYKVSTPTAVIGVRGTDFAVYVNRSGTTLTLLHLGAVRVCLSRRKTAGKRQSGDKCRDATQPNTYIIAQKNQISGPFTWNGTNPFRILTPNSQPENDSDNGNDNADNSNTEEPSTGPTNEPSGGKQPRY